MVEETERAALSEDGNLPITRQAPPIDIHPGTGSVLEYLMGPS